MKEKYEKKRGIKMYTPDERAECLKQVRSAYQTLELFENMKKEGDEAKNFAETAFSLNAYAIAAIAKTFDFSSKVKEELEERSRENRERNEKIQILEKQLASNLEPDNYQKNVQQAFKKIEEMWKEHGFSGTYKPIIRQYGNVSLTFLLHPIHDMWDMLLEEEDEKKVEELFRKRKQVFDEKGFEVINNSSYVYILDNDTNKQKIQNLLQQLFPTLEIYKWDAQKQENVFILSRVEVAIKSLQFLEEIV